MSGRPSGTVTFLFTDIEGSTRLLDRLGERYAQALGNHRALLRAAFQSHGGLEEDTEGDAFFYVFARAKDGLLATVAGQRALAAHPWPDGLPLRVRMGLHTGEPLETAEGYVGLDVHRAARICAAAHGGQILLSQTTRDLVAEILSEGLLLKDLGEHRLKDLIFPIRLYQVEAPGLSSDFPVLRSVEIYQNNLPSQLTSFVGREKEMAEVKHLLASTRLLTLIGPGGSGKTRLALQAGTEVLDRYPDGVWWVDFAPLEDAAQVPGTVAAALGLKETWHGNPVESLESHLQTKSLLIVLDNCEHVLSACATISNTLLTRCPRQQILATSREGLGVAGEHLYPVPPLQVPNPHDTLSLERVATHGAIQLFVDRATVVDPHFAINQRNAPAVVEICHRLDGMPLAVEMAAARVKALSVAEIATRLSKALGFLHTDTRASPPRHHTLRATMDWSFGLLSAQERVVFRRLAMFSGGFTLEAAEAVCGGGQIKPSEVLASLMQLVEKSLVAREEWNNTSRFRLLEIVREYARERLADADEIDSVAGRHLQFFTDLAEGLDRDPTVIFDNWLSRLEPEHGNLQTGLEWALANGHGERALRCAAAVWPYWFFHGHLDGAKTLEDALAQTTRVPDDLRMRSLNGLGYLTMWRDNYKGAVDICDESLVISRRLADRPAIATALAIQGHCTWHMGQEQRGEELCEEALKVARESSSLHALTWAVREYAYVRWHTGDIERGQPLFQEYLTLSRKLGNTPGTRDALRLIAEAALTRGDFATARTGCEEALRISKLTNDAIIVSVVQVVLGQALAGLGRYAEARRWYRESLTSLRGAWQRWWLARCLTSLGCLDVAEQSHLRGARILGAASAVREAVGGTLPPSDKILQEAALSAVRAAVGDDKLNTALLEGRAWTVEQAIDEALQ